FLVPVAFCLPVREADELLSASSNGAIRAAEQLSASRTSGQCEFFYAFKGGPTRGIGEYALPSRKSDTFLREYRKSQFVIRQSGASNHAVELSVIQPPSVLVGEEALEYTALGNQGLSRF